MSKTRLIVSEDTKEIRGILTEIEEIIEEYGNSLNEEEKINILLDIIKKIM